MSYKITELNSVVFADNKRIKLPRFQRKETWEQKDNFKLCISVFKGYPIGVVIVNSLGEVDYLLDGRQRRNALKKMKDNPKDVYLWAKKFIGFKNTDSETELVDKYYTAIDEYLQHKAYEGDTNEDPDYEESNYNKTILADQDKKYLEEEQAGGLRILLDLIKICHPMRDNVTEFEKLFKFNNIIPTCDLFDYIDIDGGEYVVNPIKLKKFVDNINNEEIQDVESFSTFIIRKFHVVQEKQNMLKEFISRQWDKYSNILKVIQKTNDVISQASLGMISLTNADVLDAQNIFSLVNASGTKLTAEELLSARPFWNKPLIQPSAELIEHKRDMYKYLKIDLPEETCRWDLCATFLNRIDKNCLIFSKNNEAFTTNISLSYKIISAIFVGGINNTSVMSLEKENINWDIDIDRLIREINLVISLIENIQFFKYVASWNQSIMNLSSNTIAIEFLVILYKDWLALGKPDLHSANIGIFNKHAVYLFDKLVYEYSMRIWSGSSDSLISAHIKNYSSRFVPVTTDEWINFIDEISDGYFKGKATTTKTLKPFIYHYYFLQKMIPTLKNETCKYEIDHIIAQNLFTSNDAINNDVMNSFYNFALLPKGENIAKTDKKLNEIHDDWLVEQIKKYTGLTYEQMEILSNLDNLAELETRKDMYKKVYTDKRNALFANI